MAKLTLGKTYWPRMSGEEQKEFTDLFVKTLKETYLDRLSEYTDQQVVYEAPVYVKNKIHLPTTVISGEQRVSVKFKMFSAKDTWKVYDIEFEGISLIQTYRTQFREILQNGTVEDLLVKLRGPPKA